MAEFEDAILFFFRYASSQDLVSPLVKKFRFFLEIMPEVLEEFLLFVVFPSLRSSSCNQIVNNMCKPRDVSCLDGYDLLIRKCLLDRRGINYFKPRKVICHRVFTTLFVSNF